MHLKLKEYVRQIVLQTQWIHAQAFTIISEG